VGCGSRPCRVSRCADCPSDLHAPGRRVGSAVPWRELLELVFDENRDIERTHALRAGVTRDDSFDREDVYYALRRFAVVEMDDL
jgi:hypothetical protein